ncbi:N-acyl homoserine lactonase family protein [Sphingomonas sp. BIUV-7]|uniref:N-acyl homoserine lactonase family protein n=1 Tax=Sphingomonas natans TaxID=3063330 RepID=A0ABT8Y4G0_9SPHN|nr:N-acyl homoserine lactonase family protein [Sphingomonas sp. BIUV-7]MDO6413193.1 N-acyl homoserine lactonase family protein [Sphingomonas sp. BIUV-7]
MTIPDLDFLSDSFAFSGQSKTVTVSCYLIRHGDTFMLWDTGLPLSRLGAGQRSVGGGLARLERSLPDQLREIGVAPASIKIVGLSHYHADHAGQLASFPGATALLGAQDMAVVKGEGTAFNLDSSQFPAATKFDPVQGDRDVFGDGTVVMLATPGHTPGHHSLLVRLASGPVLLTGDLWHFAGQRPIRGVPKINTSRAETLASIDRIEQVAANLHAKIVLGHEPADILLLPAFPKSAE